MASQVNCSFNDKVYADGVEVTAPIVGGNVHIKQMNVEVTQHANPGAIPAAAQQALQHNNARTQAAQPQPRFNLLGVVTGTSVTVGRMNVAEPKVFEGAVRKTATGELIPMPQEEIPENVRKLLAAQKLQPPVQMPLPPPGQYTVQNSQYIPLNDPKKS